MKYNLEKTLTLSDSHRLNNTVENTVNNIIKSMVTAIPIIT